MQRPDHAPRAPTPTPTTNALVSPDTGTASAPQPPTCPSRWSRRAHATPGPIGPTEPIAAQTVIRIAPPRAPSLPRLGDTLKIVFGDPIRYAQRRLKRYGPVWRGSYQGKPAVFFVGEDIHRLFARNPVQPDGSRLLACGPAYTILLAFLGMTLLNMDGDQHAAHRRALAPLFSPRYRAAFLQRLNHILTEELVARLRDDVGTLDILPIAHRIAFRAGAWLILGLDADDPRFAAFEHLWRDLPPGIFSLTPGFLPASPQTKAKRARERLNTFLAALVQTSGPGAPSGTSQEVGLTTHLGAEVDTRSSLTVEDGAQSQSVALNGQPTYAATREAQMSTPSAQAADDEETDATARPTILTLLLALSPEEKATLGMADELAFNTQTCDHALSILFASIFTTAGIIAWAIAELARRPDLQARLVGAVADAAEELPPSPTASHLPDTASATASATASGMTADDQREGAMQSDDGTRQAGTDGCSALIKPNDHIDVAFAALAWAQRTPAYAGSTTPTTLAADPIVTVRPVTLAETSHPFIQALLIANHQRHHIAPAVARLALHDFDYPYVPLAHAAIPKAFRLRTRASARPSSRRGNDSTTTPPQLLYHIPKGVLAVALSGATQQLPDYFGDQAQFYPDRFFVHHADRMHPHALFPFGGGEHRCLGSAFADLEIATTLIKLTRTCTFALPTGAPFPSAVYLPSNQPRALTITYQRRDAVDVQPMSLATSPASTASVASPALVASTGRPVQAPASPGAGAMWFPTTPAHSSTPDTRCPRVEPLTSAEPPIQEAHS